MSGLDYPVALRLAGRPVLLVGAGKVAEGRLEALLEAGAQVHAVAPTATELFHRRAAEGRLRLSLRSYRPGDCEGSQLVFTATGDLEVSRAVASEARARGLLINAADLPELCDFYIPSVGRRGPVTVAVSTAGLAPSVAAIARRRAMKAIGPEYGLLARLIGRLRLRLPRGPARTQVFAALGASEVPALLAKGQRRLAWQRVRQILREGA
jgi:precorrin-2 dehydrogenase/sirohydrochlorin ferrochelatase